MTQRPENRNIGLLIFHATQHCVTHGYPHNVLQPDRVVTLDGTDYSVTWLQSGFDTMSPTRKHSVTVINRATGQQVTIHQIIEKSTRTGVRYNCRAIDLNLNGSEQVDETIVRAAAELIAQRAQITARPQVVAA